MMIVGTGSSVGKSILVTGLCRAFNNRGIAVAPFKSQNMSLNSYITSNGKEMGRAQVAQAEAARIEPSVHMNPILLKPTTDMGSQVIVQGKVYRNMGAREYFAHKEQFISPIMDSWSQLSSEYEVILIEGAGSPAEINLRDKDIVNMGLADLVDTDVLIVGDVDRGGVFAAIYGTFLLLQPSEQERVKGFVINKFRGDQSLLDPGVKQLEELIHRPCLGVIPYVKQLMIDDEDSVTDRLQNKEGYGINIGVIRLPYMSNFTDFTVFESEDEVTVSFVTDPEDLATKDWIIIPGSKNTMADMRYLAQNGFRRAVIQAQRQGIPIFGICGGFQMLGNEIYDPYGVESDVHSISGLGLLPMKTEMANQKRTVQSVGTVVASYITDSVVKDHVTGYEIHMGNTKAMEDHSITPFIQTVDHEEGAISDDGLVAGTYFHGIFDNDAFRAHILSYFKQKKGLSQGEIRSFAEIKDQAYDRLAQVMEEHLDMDQIIQLMEESCI